MIDCIAYKEKKDENGIPYAYLLRSPNDKNLYCVVTIENDVPTIDDSTGFIYKKNSELAEDDWENLSSSKKEIEKYIVNNMSVEDIGFLENNFYLPEETEKTFLLDFVKED